MPDTKLTPEEWKRKTAAHLDMCIGLYFSNKKNYQTATLGGFLSLMLGDDLRPDWFTEYIVRSEKE